MLGSDYEEVMEDGKVLLFVRNGILQARIYKGDRGYLYRSLKTKDVAIGRKEALRLFHEMEFKQREGLPLTQISMSQLIDEYVEMREDDHKLSLNVKQTASTQQHTSEFMLRQIKRVVKFWREFCGNVSVDRVDDGMLRDYIPWRKQFYHRMPVQQRPKNYKLNPTDKTLQWELTLGKMLIKYAHDRGYRGKMQLPTFSFTAKKKIVRPPFTRQDFKTLLQALRDLLKKSGGEKYYYARRLLQTYVLIVSDTGMRVGEANNLKWGDLTPIVDGRGRKNYEIKVRGKTGSRTVIGRSNVFG